MKLPQPQRFCWPVPEPFFTVLSPMMYNTGFCFCNKAKEQSPIITVRANMILLTRIRCSFFYRWNNCYSWFLRHFHTQSHKKTGMRRLIVGHILPGNAEAVMRVLHKSVKLIIGGDSGGQNAQLFIVFCAIDHFFAPVAYNI